MNFKNLESDFSIRYNTKTKPCFAYSGTPLYIMGDLSFPHCGHSLITSISSGTALSMTLDGPDYSIQQTSDNTVFSCDEKNLLSYSEKNYAAPIFHVIYYLNSYFKIDSKGLNILYEHNTNTKGFHNYLSPLISAFLKLFSDSSPEDVLKSLSSMKFPKRDYLSLMATLSLVKGHIILADNLSLITKDYLLPTSDTKIIIIKTDQKPKRLFADFSPTTDSDQLTLHQQRILSFFIKEEWRILKYPEIANSSEFYGLVNDSGEDLLSLIDAPHITLLTKIVQNSSALCSRPILNSSSIYAIVPDPDVDKFIDYVGLEHEKKAGYKPTFYITDTCDSGIKSHIETE